MSFLSKQHADNIIKEIGLDLDYDINIMDENGIIISSTVSSRIGDLHIGAKNIVDHKLDKYIVNEFNTEPFMKQGVNLPILYKDKIIGVIGITGSIPEVEKVGNIVRKMTEILIYENIKKNNDSNVRRIIYRFVDKWMLIENIEQNKNFINNGKNININVLLPRRCLVIDYNRSDQLILSLEGQEKIRKMDEDIRSMVKSIPDIVYYHLKTEQYFFVPVISNSEISALFFNLRKLIMSKYNESLFGGFDGTIAGTTNINSLLNEALMALDCADEENELLSYNDLTLEPLINTITEKESISFLERFFKTKDYNLIADYIVLISVYFENDGSIQDIAENLYIHKNTVQYRIKKMTETTGYDIRKPKHCANFFIAKLLFDKYLS